MPSLRHHPLGSWNENPHATGHWTIIFWLTLRPNSWPRPHAAQPFFIVPQALTPASKQRQTNPRWNSNSPPKRSSPGTWLSWRNKSAKSEENANYPSLHQCCDESKTVWLQGDPMFPTVNQGKQIAVASLWKAVHQKFILRQREMLFQSVSQPFRIYLPNLRSPQRKPSWTTSQFGRNFKNAPFCCWGHQTFYSLEQCPRKRTARRLLSQTFTVPVQPCAVRVLTPTVKQVRVKHVSVRPFFL